MAKTTQDKHAVYTSMAAESLSVQTANVGEAQVQCSHEDLFAYHVTETAKESVRELLGLTLNKKQLGFTPGWLRY